MEKVAVIGDTTVGASGTVYLDSGSTEVEIRGAAIVRWRTDSDPWRYPTETEVPAFIRDQISQGIALLGDPDLPERQS